MENLSSGIRINVQGFGAFSVDIDARHVVRARFSPRDFEKLLDGQ
jgi:nucleoid DNA-binding protein